MTTTPTPTQEHDGTTLTRNIVMATFLQAVRDLQRPRPRPRKRGKWTASESRDWHHARVSAACWLASRAAAPYFDALGLDQLDALAGMREAPTPGQVEAGPVRGWAYWARDILRCHTCGEHRLKPPVAAHIRRALAILDDRNSAAA